MHSPMVPTGVDITPLSVAATGRIEVVNQLGRRVPLMPKAGPGQAAAKAAGTARSSRRRPETCRSSNRLPAMVAIRLGSDGPRLASGQDRSSVQRV